MFITNPFSNLTPVPRVVAGALPNTLGGVLLSKKCKGVKTHYREDANRGFNEHHCIIPSSMPYVSVRNVF